MHLQLGEVTTIVVSSSEIAKEFLKTNDVIFAQRPFILAASVVACNFQDIAFAPYGDYWRQLQKICTLELLTAKRVQSFRSIREDEVSKLIRSVYSSAESGSPVNFSGMFISLTFSIISKAAFGKTWKGEEIFIPNVKQLLEAGGGFSVADLYPSVKFLHVISTIKPRVERLHRKIDKIFQDIIDQHRARKAATKSGDHNQTQEEQEHEQEQDLDFVDVLLNFQQKGDIQFRSTDDNIKAVIMDMFIAGSETSSRTVVWAMSEMLKDPRVMEKAQAEVRQVFNKKGYVDEDSIGELKYLNSVIKETLRLHPPLPLLLPRECSEKCVIRGYDIPIKSRIIVNAMAIGRDPNYWIEAERFYPERFLDSSVDFKGTDFKLIPFGAGRRICPGILFGMANVEFPLAQLLYYFDWKLPNQQWPEDLDMTQNFGAVVTRKNDLHIIPIPSLPRPVG
uniref:Cytochrome p450 n=1 Tax=Croton stellatopilosus TaxID=431156 RepID=A0A3G2CK13_9ROSI|nr:cytochrome p450 [Croton stellatopilosus]